MYAVPVMHFTNIPLDSTALSTRDAVRSLNLGTREPPSSVGDYRDTNTVAEGTSVLPSVNRRGQWVAVNSVQAPFQSLQEEVKGCFGVVQGNYLPFTVNGSLHHHRFAFSRGLGPHSHREYQPLHLQYGRLCSGQCRI